jgi:hypothetical protein
VDIRCNLCDQQIYEDSVYDDQYSWAVTDMIEEAVQSINDHYRNKHRFKELMTVNE